MIQSMKKGLRAFAQDESGQGMVEYGLIIGLVAIALVTTVTLLNGGLKTVFGNITSTLNNSTCPAGTTGC